MRRFGSPPVQGHKYTPRVGVYAIILHGSKILLTEQNQPEIEPEVQLPGGGIDPGEHRLTALHREAYEETGWKIAPISHFGSYRRFTYMPEYNLHAMKIAHIYLCKAVRRLGPPTEPFHKAVWVGIEHAPALLGPVGDQHFVRAFLALSRR